MSALEKGPAAAPAMRDYSAARERYAPPPRLHVVMRKEDIESSRLNGRVAIVLDILFATTTIVTALDRGATAVIPAENPEEARRLALMMDSGTYTIAGEDRLAAIPGFATALPLALTRTAGFAGKPLVYSTTNGTVALRHARGADAVYAACLHNVGATLDHVARHHPDKPVVIVCAGSVGAMNLEDFAGAGCFVERLMPAMDPTRDVSDSALAALAAYRAQPIADAILASRIGRIVAGAGGEDEARFTARVDGTPLVAMLDGDRVVRVG